MASAHKKDVKWMYDALGWKQNGTNRNKKKSKSRKKMHGITFTMLASEKVLRKDWENEIDEQWNNV